MIIFFFARIVKTKPATFVIFIFHFGSPSAAQAISDQLDRFRPPHMACARASECVLEMIHH